MKGVDMNSIINRESKRFTEVMSKVAMEHYNISSIINTMRMKPCTDLSAPAAVDKNGRGLFNPLLTESLSTEDIKFLIMHEAFHVLLRHIQRYENIEGEDYSKFEYWNIAADTYINENLFKVTNSKIDGIVDIDYACECSGLTREEIFDTSTEGLYEAIVKNMKGKSKNDNDDGGGEGASSNSGKGNNPFTFDNNNASTGGASDGSAATTSEVMSKINEYYSEDDDYSDFDNYTSAHGVGYNSSAEKDQDIVYEIISKNIKWKNILNQFVTEVGGKHATCRTWRKPNRKYRDVYPVSKGKARRGTKRLVFSIDVSGSMDSDKIDAVVSVIHNYVLNNRVRCEYYFFNSETHERHTFKNIDEFAKQYGRVHGGGTSFKAAINCGNDVDGLVIISDMEFGSEATIEGIDEKNIPYKFLDIDPDASTSCKSKPIVNCKDYVKVY